ncbi:formylmethanofuran dehydrogenase subunit E [Candidatus Magnetomoraceae bacterium gMMP-1]
MNTQADNSQKISRSDLWCRNYEGHAYSYEEFLNFIQSFHGHAAPGLIVGGRMMDLAMKGLEKGILFDALCETANCLPDAVQLLSLCTTGNGWLKVIHLGRFALTLYDKYNGKGVRVFLDPAKINAWPEIKTWFYKLKSKMEQDSQLLRKEIKEAGDNLFSVQEVTVKPQLLEKRGLGKTIDCPLCGEAFPASHGAICRACQGEAPYLIATNLKPDQFKSPELISIPVEKAEGRQVLHDMTQIIPGKEKGPAFKHGQILNAGDVCRLQQMGRQSVYVDELNSPGEEWVHENKAALSFAKAMAGQGIFFNEVPKEGRITFQAALDGLLIVDKNHLEAFNSIPGVMCATRQSYSVVSKERQVGGTRAIPLYLPKNDFHKAMSIIKQADLLKVIPLRQAKTGILITGTEVFLGLIKDGFDPIIRGKVKKLGCQVVKSIIVPDDKKVISESIKELIELGIDLLITTAGLSVDPDDVTKQGLMDAGAEDMLYGAPILPGAMTLLTNIGNVQVIGVPACALYFKTTSLDLLLPRLLAGLKITRQDLAKMGHGAFCLECKVCKFPRCPFGK